MDYRLDDAAIRRRARAVALLGSLALVAPGALIAILVAGRGVLQNGMVLVTAGLLLLLALVRAAVLYNRLLRQLARFSVQLSGNAKSPETGETAAALVIRTGQRTIELRPQSIERFVEIGGVLGGVRVRIAEGERLELPLQIDIPRGGEGFPELLRALAAFAPGAHFAPVRRRSRATGIGRGVVVVAALFFLPFFAVDFVHRSRLVAYGVALLAFFLVRAALRPNG